MARTQSHIITPDMGTVEVTCGSRQLTFTVHTGAIRLAISGGFFKAVDFRPVGPDVMTASMTDTDNPAVAGYVLRDTRTPQQRQMARYA